MQPDNYREKVEFYVTRALQELLGMQRGNVCHITPSHVARYIKKKYGYDFSRLLKLVSEIISRNAVVNVWALRDEVILRSPRGSYHVYIYRKNAVEANTPRIIRQIVSKA